MSKLECDDLLKAVAATRLLTSEQLDEARRVGALMDQSQPEMLAAWMQKQGWLTPWQAKTLVAGRTDFFVGKYKLLDEIHEGGLGTTYRAWQPGLGRHVVVKVMSRKLFGSPESAAQLHKEVQAAAAVTHPNLMYIFDSEQIGGQFFLVNESIDALDLNTWQRKYHPLPVSEVVSCFRQAGLAMQKAFESRVIHGNIKPSNVLVLTDSVGKLETVKVVNMGLGMLSRDLAHAAEIDSADQTVTSPDYISPEQAEDFTAVDVRSDLFSLGCLMYRALTGENPFGGRNATEKILARVKRDAPPVSKLRADAASLDTIVAKLLARDPNFRYQTPKEFLAALDALTPAAAAAPTPTEPALKIEFAEDAATRRGPERTPERHASKTPLMPPGTEGDEFGLAADGGKSASGSSIRSSGSSLNLSKSVDQKPSPRASSDESDELMLAPTEGAHLLGAPVAKAPPSESAPVGPAPTARAASLTPLAAGPTVKPVAQAPAPNLAMSHSGGRPAPTAAPSPAPAPQPTAAPAPAPAATGETKSEPDADLAPQAKAGEIAVMRPKEGEPGGPVWSVASLAERQVCAGRFGCGDHALGSEARAGRPTIAGPYRRRLFSHVRPARAHRGHWRLGRTGRDLGFAERQEAETASRPHRRRFVRNFLERRQIPTLGGPRQVAATVGRADGRSRSLARNDRLGAKCFVHARQSLRVARRGRRCARLCRAAVGSLGPARAAVHARPHRRSSSCRARGGRARGDLGVVGSQRALVGRDDRRGSRDVVRPLGRRSRRRRDER